MRRLRFRRPSPAMVVACVALAITLSGTSYAVATQLPRNSVGTPQLKNNAVTSIKVANRSLRAIDFALGQIPAGPPGPAGPAGPAGAAGPAGPAGPGARWALVNSAGTIVAQSGGISVAFTSGGIQILNFGSQVTGKLILTSVGLAGGNTASSIWAGPCGGPPEGTAGACPFFNDTNHVVVRTSAAVSYYVSLIG